MCDVSAGLVNLVVARSPEPSAETSLPSELLTSLQSETSQQQDMVVGTADQSADMVVRCFMGHLCRPVTCLMIHALLRVTPRL